MRDAGCGVTFTCIAILVGGRVGGGRERAFTRARIARRVMRDAGCGVTFTCIVMLVGGEWEGGKGESVHTPISFYGHGPRVAIIPDYPTVALGHLCWD